jgi:vacuolar-type H+-ATPase subunit F/Vma7
MRLIVMGGDALTEGFALLGFESFTNPTAETVEQVIGELLRTGEKALVYLEDGVAPTNSKALARVRREGGCIVITEVPAVNAPRAYRARVEDLVERVLGPSALEEKS